MVIEITRNNDPTLGINILLDKLIKICEVEVEDTSSFLEVSYYDPEEHTIYINPLVDSAIGKSVKKSMKRPTDPGWTLAHEVGHAFAETFELGEDKEICNLFGDFYEDYPEDGLRESCKLKLNPKFITRYCQVHPEEDFADTFAFVIINYDKGKTSKNRTLKKKIKLVECWIEDVLLEYA